MKKHLLLIATLTTLSLGVFAQQKTYKIDYKLYVSDEVRNIDIDTEQDPNKQMMAGLAEMLLTLEEGDTPALELWVNEDFVRAVTHVPDNESIQITDKKTQQYYTLYPEIEQYAISPAIVTNMHTDSDGTRALSDLPIEYMDGETKTIAGYTCKQARIQVAPGFPEMNVDIWYTAELPKAYWSNDYVYLEKLPGAALHVSTMGVGIQATNVAAVATDPSLFQVPDTYTLEQPILGVNSPFPNDELGHGRVLYNDEDSYLSGIMDTDGNILTKPLYGMVTPFHEGRAVATDEHYRYGLIDVNGKELLPFEYEFLQYEPEEKILTFVVDGQYGLMTPEGEIIMPARYDYLATFHNGYAMVSKDGISGLIDGKGNEVIPLSHDFIHQHSKTHLISVDADSRYALYNISTGKRTSDFYEEINLTEEPNLFLARKNDRYGFIDSNGKVVIPFRFGLATIFKNGVAEVWDPDSDSSYRINTKGETLNKTPAK